MPAVNPAILAWARETAGLSSEDAAKKIGLKAARGVSAVDRLAALEAGTQVPSRPLLLRMSKQYRRPLLVFYMSKPPRLGDRGRDFRTLPASYSSSENALVDALLRDVAARQGMVRASLEEQDEAQALEFVGSIKAADDVPMVVRALEIALRTGAREIWKQPNADAVFALLRERTEALGVFVLLIGNLGSHHSTLSVATFRGLVLADPIAPFIVINDQDTKPAWSFSLLHELAHLFLGQTGVSGSAADSGIEQFCNDVASHFLLPSGEIGKVNVFKDTPTDVALERIQYFARSRNLSGSMVAYRLFRSGAIGMDKWQAISGNLQELWLKWRATSKAASKSQEGGPDYYVVRRHRLGNGLVTLVERMMTMGALTTTKAAIVLGVKPQGVGTLLSDVGHRDGKRAA